MWGITLHAAAFYPYTERLDIAANSLKMQESYPAALPVLEGETRRMSAFCKEISAGRRLVLAILQIHANVCIVPLPKGFPSDE